MDSTIIGLSCISAIAARTATHPLDTIKIRRQAGVSIGFKDILISPSSALKSLYRGYGVAILLSTPATSIYLSSYELVKKKLALHTSLSSDSILIHSISGAVAELTAGCVFTPMEVIKTRMQVNSDSSFTSVSGRNIFTQILKENGFKGLFRGYFLSLAVFGPYSVAYFVMYERFKQLFSSKDEVLYSSKIWLASSLSVAIAATISNPMDVIKVRWQMASPGSSNQTVSELVKSLMSSKKFSIFPFFRGSLARVIWLVPSTSITFTLFELLKKYVNLDN